MNRAAFVAAIATAACRNPTPAPETPAKAPAANKASASESVDRARIADDALKADWTLDFELPMADKPRDRARIAKLFLDACNAGDHPSCWKAMEVVEASDRASVEKLVVANCTGGDTMSCRALPASPLDAFPDAPGAVGRSSACDDSESTTCSRDALEGECTAGFPRSCIKLGLMFRDAQRDSLLDRVFTLSREGCDAWILGDCTRIGDHDGDPRLEFALQRACELTRGCTGYGSFLKTTNPTKARDLIERTCQYKGVEMACQDLALDYLDGKLPEPVKGRGQALLDWSCARMKASMPKGMDFLERNPGCKRASK